jgi:hypothetical protein
MLRGPAAGQGNRRRAGERRLPELDGGRLATERRAVCLEKGPRFPNRNEAQKHQLAALGIGKGLGLRQRSRETRVKLFEISQL